MSTINDKIFNPAKKVRTAIFKGAPNLLTAPDLNRQFEGINHQLEQLYDKSGFVTDYSATYTANGYASSRALVINPSATYLYLNGCAYTPTYSEVSRNTVSNGDIYYLALTAKKRIIKLSNDEGRKISGAFFQDGTQKEAAEHEIYYEEAVVLYKSTEPTPANFIKDIASYKIALDLGRWRVVEIIYGAPLKASLQDIPPKITSAPVVNDSDRIFPGMNTDTALIILRNLMHRYEGEGIAQTSTVSITNTALGINSQGYITHKYGKILLTVPTILATVPNKNELYYNLEVSIDNDNFELPALYDKALRGNLEQQGTQRDSIDYVVGTPFQADLGPIEHNNGNVYLSNTITVTPLWSRIYTGTENNPTIIKELIRLSLQAVNIIPADMTAVNQMSQMPNFIIFAGAQIAIRAQIVELHLK